MPLAKVKAFVLPADVTLSEVLLPSRTMKRRMWPIALGLGYILIIWLLGFVNDPYILVNGLKARHVMMGLLGLLDAYNERTRRFLKYFFPFMLTGIVYDSMRYYYWRGIEGHIHIAEPYYLEKALFGINEGGKILSPNEFFQIHTWMAADFLCGLSYLIFVAWYLSAAFILYFARCYNVLRAFGWCFFLVNVLGFITYYIYPAAPPWYVIEYGLGPAKMFIGATPSAAVRFDRLLGTHFFDAMYGNSVDVYGAIPSLHVAYPLLVAWAALVVKKLRAPTIGFYFLMCFSAVYLQHHYIIDIAFGTLYSLVALIVVRSVQEGRRLQRIPLSKRLVCLLWPTPCFGSEAEESHAAATSRNDLPGIGCVSTNA